VNELNESVQHAIDYIRFSLLVFVDMREKEWIRKVLWDKFGKVYFVFVSSKFVATCYDYT